MIKKKLILFCLTILLMTSISALPQDTGTEINFKYETPINYSNIVINETSNQSEYWNTNIGSLNGVNTTQFEEQVGDLGIKTSWLDTFINSFDFLTSHQSLSHLVPYTGATGDVNLGSNDLFVDGNVGIGTDSPENKLDIYLNTANAQDTLLKLWKKSLSAGVLTESSLDFSQTLSGDPTQRISGIRPHSGVGLFDLAFSTYGASGLTEQMRIDSSGNVGIGTDSPSEALDINGNLTLNGLIDLQGTGTNEIQYGDYYSDYGDTDIGGIGFGSLETDNTYAIANNHANMFFRKEGSTGSLYLKGRGAGVFLDITRRMSPSELFTLPRSSID